MCDIIVSAKEVITLKYKYTSGQIVEGVVTGIQPYGAFVLVDDTTSGLIHISEISEYFVKDVHQFVNVGDKVKIKIIDVDGEQLRLSLKALRNSNNRKERMYRQQKLLPPDELGFSTIRAMLPEWKKEKLK